MPKLISNGRCIPYDPDLIDLAKKLRNNVTIHERKLWYFLREIKPRVLRQRPILYYIADFYCPAKKLVIEIDGTQHQSTEGREKDALRKKILNGHGINVIRFTNRQIDNEFSEVCEIILEYLKN
ncbi:DUF559 domain-containing protein [Candidatus Uhrbacteria bacterium]|nr:DUF559 domain-containing protein [Candidatus Uhrbacteria bacterium]